MLRWSLAVLHLTALGIGLGGVWVRPGAAFEAWRDACLLYTSPSPRDS